MTNRIILLVTSPRQLIIMSERTLWFYGNSKTRTVYFLEMPDPKEEPRLFIFGSQTFRKQTGLYGSLDEPVCCTLSTIVSNTFALS